MFQSFEAPLFPALSLNCIFSLAYDMQMPLCLFQCLANVVYGNYLLFRNSDTLSR